MFLLLFLFWIILNGRVTVEIVVIGAAVSAVLTFAAHKTLGDSPRKEVLFWPSGLKACGSVNPPSV